jgi:predicted ATPase/class 3 adenylate cyclase
MHRAVEPPTGTVTFLFTDIEGSTRLLRALGDAYADLLAEHHRLLLEAVERAGGVAVGTEGDSLFAAFASATSAIAAAVEAQRLLAAHPWPAGAPFRVRMGLHTGEGQVRDGDYVGIDVHRAARIAAVGSGGQILVSESTRGLVEQTLPAGVELRDLGRHRLKDLPEPERIYDAVIGGLPSEFPPLHSLDAMPNNLPAQLTSFVGRAREVAEARRLLAESRLLTLTGPGGTGKTRLGLQVAAEVLPEYPDGVFFVPLDTIDNDSLVAQAIVQAVGVRHAGDRSPAERLAAYLAGRHLLLVLDNFEQVIGAAPLVGDLLKAGPGVRALVTSRATLHLYGEREYAVPPLGVPEIGAAADLQELACSEAVALFVQRATAVKPDFTLTPANAAAVVQICARLDGLPLAIELAAARIKLLPPQALLARLGGRLDTLDTASRNLPARQQTLRGAISWSHDLLQPDAKRLFARFAVFVGGAELDEAQAVCGDGPTDVLAGLAGLVDQSLLRQEEADGEPRFTMLLTIREFALEMLAGSGEAEEMAERHAAVYLALAEASAPGLTGAAQKSLLDRLDRENGNLRASLAWSIERGRAETALRLGSALWRLWQMRGLLSEGAEWLRKILAMPETEAYPKERAAALEAAGGVAYWRGQMDPAMTYYRDSLELCRRVGDPRAVANALYNLGFPTLVVRSDVARSKAAFEESLAMYRALGDKEMIARVLWGLGNAYYFAGEPAASRDALLENIEMLRGMSDPFSLNWALHTLGLAYHGLGEDAKSEPGWREALQYFAAVQDISGITFLLGDFALLAREMGDQLRSIRITAASDRLAEAGGAQLGAMVATIDDLRPDTTALDPAVVEAAIAEGRRMTVDEAVAYALSGDPARVAGTGGES